MKILLHYVTINRDNKRPPSKDNRNKHSNLRKSTKTKKKTFLFKKMFNKHEIGGNTYYILF